MLVSLPPVVMVVRRPTIHVLFFWSAVDEEKLVDGRPSPTMTHRKRRHHDPNEPRPRHPGADPEPARPHLAPDGLGHGPHRAEPDLQPGARFLLLHRRAERRGGEPGRRHPDPYRQRRVRGARDPARFRRRHGGRRRLPAQRPVAGGRQPFAGLGDRAADLRRRRFRRADLQPGAPVRHRRRGRGRLQPVGDRGVPRGHPPAGAAPRRGRARCERTSGNC